MAETVKTNGCHNTQRADGYHAQDGWQNIVVEGHETRVPKLVWVKNRMSQTCQYDRRAGDSGCAGCKG